MNWRNGLGVFVLALVIGGCGNKGGETADNPTNPTNDSGVDLVQAPPGLDKPTGKMEVIAFKGGYDIDFYAKAAKEFDSKNPGLSTTVDGNPRVWEQLQPRLAGDSTPPDLMFPGWDMDHWALAEEGSIMLLDKALDSPAYGASSGSWRDTFEPEILKLGQKDGHQYVLPYYFSLWGWWYDPGLFAKNGWTAPKSYSELLALCAKIKAKGIAPITFQGKYPYYMIQGMLLPWAQSVGGRIVVDNAQDLTPGAWQDPSILKAAQMIKELNDKGYFEKGAVGLSHTESQTDFLNGKAAMIPCGTWLESEMRKVTPPGAKMMYMLPPAVTGGQGDPGAVFIEIEPWMVPTKAKNANGAVALFKYMTSLPKAKEFIEQKSTLMSIKGSDQAKLPATLIEPSRVFKSSKTAMSFLARQWYREMEKDIEGALTSMLNNEITPEQFCERAEAAAEKTRKDSGIAKHKAPRPPLPTPEARPGSGLSVER